MNEYVRNLGKVGITLDSETWSNTKVYEKLTIVKGSGNTGWTDPVYISKIDVPAGKALTNTTYWEPLLPSINVSSGAVKPDWNAASGTDAEILNKPTIPVVPTDIVKYSSQSLNAAQQAQARSNISAVKQLDLVKVTDAELRIANNTYHYYEGNIDNDFAIIDYDLTNPTLSYLRFAVGATSITLADRVTNLKWINMPSQNKFTNGDYLIKFFMDIAEVIEL